MSVPNRIKQRALDRRRQVDALPRRNFANTARAPSWRSSTQISSELSLAESSFIYDAAAKAIDLLQQKGA